MTEQVQTKAITPTQEFRVQFQKMEQDIGMALPPHIPVDRFMRVVLTAVNGDPDLVVADRRSLFEAAMKAAQDGLLPDKRDGAFVIFNTKIKDAQGREKWCKAVQWMPMIAGILKKVRNSGELREVSAHVVYEKDKFSYALGDNEHIEHLPSMESERGDPIAVYAIAKTKNGGIYREVMSVADVEKIRAISKAKDSGPWKQWWDEMAKKTVLRRLSKRLPMSTDLDDLIRRDDALYSFDSQGAMAGTANQIFKPVANPLLDTSPQEEAPTIEHNADGVITNDQSNSPGAGAPEAKPGEGAEAESPAALAPNNDAIKQAHQAGRKAALEGKSTRAMPAAFKEEGRLPEGNAWLAGHSEATAEAEG